MSEPSADRDETVAIGDRPAVRRQRDRAVDIREAGLAVPVHVTKEGVDVGVQGDREVERLRLDGRSDDLQRQTRDVVRRVVLGTNVIHQRLVPGNPRQDNGPIARGHTPSTTVDRPRD